MAYQIRKNAVIGKTKRRSRVRSSWNSGLAWAGEELLAGWVPAGYRWWAPRMLLTLELCSAMSWLSLLRLHVTYPVFAQVDPPKPGRRAVSG